MEWVQHEELATRGETLLSRRLLPWLLIDTTPTLPTLICADTHSLSLSLSSLPQP